LGNSAIIKSDFSHFKIRNTIGIIYKKILLKILIEKDWNVFAVMSQIVTFLRKHSPIAFLKLTSWRKNMALNAEQKLTVITDNKLHEKDTGSSEVQIALISKRVTYLTEHFKTHSKDHHSRRGLLKLVSKRRKLLDHLKMENLSRYQKVITKLGIRR
tara:strand:- start:93 stop:563 length:471 start_codon:yes stop_codon:yes gene_type:complete